MIRIIMYQKGITNVYLKPRYLKPQTTLGYG